MKQIAVFWAVLIGLGWLGTLASGLITNDWTGLTIVTPLMLLATGVVLGIKPSLKKTDEEEKK